MKKRLLKKSSALALVSLLLFTGCIPANDNTIYKTKPQTKESYDFKEKEEKGEWNYIRNSSFVVGPDMKVLTAENFPKNKYSVHWLFDPHCPACVKLETLMRPHLDKLTTGGLYIRFYPMAFMGTPEDGDYSLRAGTYILSVVENVPSKWEAFFNKIISQEFFPDADVFYPDSKFKEVFLEIGGTEKEWEDVEEDLEAIAQELKINTDRAYNSSELEKMCPNDTLIVPMVVLGNSEKAIDFSEETDSIAFFLRKVEEYKETLKSPTK